MISAQELRIGNWVEVTFNGAESGFGKDYYSQIDAIQRNKVLVSGDFHWHPIEPIKPIPLTPEILLAAGFDEWADGHWKIRTSLLRGAWVKEFNYYFSYRVLSTYTGSLELKSLHQLQNLYFALTNEELQINPEKIK